MNGKIDIWKERDREGERKMNLAGGEECGMIVTLKADSKGLVGEV